MSLNEPPAAIAEASSCVVCFLAPERNPDLRDLRDTAIPEIRPVMTERETKRFKHSTQFSSTQTKLDFFELFVCGSSSLLYVLHAGLAVPKSGALSYKLNQNTSQKSHDASPRTSAVHSAPADRFSYSARFE